jgi:hypothetical protein
MQSVGLTFEEAAKNPALAMARIAALRDPNLEVLGDAEDGNSIRVRNKKSGEEFYLRVNPDTQQVEYGSTSGDGAITFDGSKGEINIRDEEGDTVVRLGGDAGEALPSWVPTYPGTSPKNTLAAKTPDGTSNTYTFKTPDSAQKVFDFYEERLKGNGFTIAARIAQPAGGMMMAGDEGEKHQVMLTIGAGGEVMIQATEKN